MRSSCVCLLILLCFSWPSSLAQLVPLPNPASPRPLVRAANLGGWLVTEGWILPSLFDGIPNKDLLVTS
jgi:hypothetical protein